MSEPIKHPPFDRGARETAIMIVMEYNGFKAKMQRAPRLADDGRVHPLPSGAPIEVHPVDAFKHPLPSWIGGPGNYVVPVRPDWGLWFDWTGNDSLNTAVMPSVKGMNPITGQKTSGFGLEQYKKKCPVHGCEFKEGLYCPECGYRWPDQNYVTSPGTLWWDGFRAGSGEVRQFFFTEDMMRSMPERVLGAEQTVPAFGFCFYKPKTPRAAPAPYVKCFDSGGPGVTIKGGALHEAFTYTSNASLCSSMPSSWHKITDVDIWEASASPVAQCLTASAMPRPDAFQNAAKAMAAMVSGIRGAMDASPSRTAQAFDAAKDAGGMLASLTSQDRIVPDCARCQETKAPVEVGVGAGAKIAQQLSRDIHEVDSWEDEPSAVMRLFFVFEEQFQDLKAKGMNDLAGDREGFMSGLPVG